MTSPSPTEASAPSDRTGPDPALGAGAQPHQNPGRYAGRPVSIILCLRILYHTQLVTRAASGFLYTAFASQADYEYVLNYARQLDVVLWENAAKRCFFGSVEGHANIRGFIERRTGGGGG
jgi:hypothetical protein